MKTNVFTQYIVKQEIVLVTGGNEWRNVAYYGNHSKLAHNRYRVLVKKHPHTRFVIVRVEETIVADSEGE